jgi:hypothetical protein
MIMTAEAALVPLSLVVFGVDGPAVALVPLRPVGLRVFAS